MKRLTVIVVILVAGLIILAELTMSSEENKISAIEPSLTFTDSIFIQETDNHGICTGKEILVISKD